MRSIVQIAFSHIVDLARSSPVNNSMWHKGSCFKTLMLICTEIVVVAYERTSRLIRDNVYQSKLIVEFSPQADTCNSEGNKCICDTRLMN